MQAKLSNLKWVNTTHMEKVALRYSKQMITSVYKNKQQRLTASASMDIGRSPHFIADTWKQYERTKFNWNLPEQFSIDVNVQINFTDLQTL